MRQHQRQMAKERLAAGEVVNSGYRGPDQSGQWVSMGELAQGDSLDEALGCLPAGLHHFAGISFQSLSAILHLGLYVHYLGPGPSPGCRGHDPPLPMCTARTYYCFAEISAGAYGLMKLLRHTSRAGVPASPIISCLGWTLVGRTYALMCSGNSCRIFIPASHWILPVKNGRIQTSTLLVRATEMTSAFLVGPLLLIRLGCCCC